MSERILKALMQLFALISSPESNKSERRRIVELFLKKQLNKQLTREYILIFDEFFDKYHEAYQEQHKIKKHISSGSVKLLVICEQINNELTQKQKFTLLTLLLSFIKSGHDENSAISAFERDFVELVADTLNLENSEYAETFRFVMLPLENIPESSNILYINNKDGGKKHLYRESLYGNLLALHVPTVDAYICRYEGSRELYLNGQEMNSGEVYMLNYGCSIRNAQIKPVYYSDIVNCFYSSEQSTPILFEALDVEYEFDSGHIGLHSINFEVLSGNIVGIMGGSGAGKSTLLSVLTGLNKPTFGNVLLNNTDIHEEAREVEGLIGYVSQDDLLIEELTVFQNLYFNAKLCFGQYNDAEIRQKTDDMLRDLGLHEIREMKVGSPLHKKISGGQRKRLNIALELIRQPSVLFLDEPTSGLSSRDSDNIIDLLKDLSLKGKLVFVVIHQPSSDIFKMFDRLIVLDKGGYLIYNGNPVDAILYFKSQTRLANRDTIQCSECGNVNPELIFNIVEACVLNEHGHATNTRRISPAEWFYVFGVSNSETLIPEDERPEEPPSLCNIKRPSRLKQFLIYAMRNVYSKASDLQYVTVCLLQAPLLAFLLSYIIRYYNESYGGYTFENNENLPIYIFVAVIIAIFIGLSVSAEEIIKDRKILKRESFLNLSRGSYLLSKTLVLFAISALQAFLFVAVGNSVTGILHQMFTYWIVLFSAWTCANLIGLIISDTFKSVVTIYIIIPFIVIPQLMLSGVLLRFEKINPEISTPASIPWYGEIITARWAFEALAVEQSTNNEYERIMYPFEKNMSIADYQRNFWIVEMRNKLDELQKNISAGEQPEPILIKLITNEIERENKRQNQVQFSFRDKMLSNGLSDELIVLTSAYFDQLSRYYSAFYNETVKKRDQMLAEITPDSIIALKTRFYNQSLSSMVKNSGETYRIVEHKDRLLQNYHQIYKLPEHPFIKAHFYAPLKRAFGNLYPTIWVNVIVIWCFNIFFFIALYFRWLPNLLNIFNKRRR